MTFYAAAKARHDKLVVLVDKRLGLLPKLRAATADSEKATPKSPSPPPTSKLTHWSMSFTD